MTTPNHDPERLERSLRVWLTEGRPALADRDAQIDSVLDSLDDTPQTRARFLGRWFDRGGRVRRGTDAHDHPPSTNRRSRLMLSATGITAALAIVALSVSVIDTEPALPSAGTPGLIVAPDGTGDFTTVQAAIDAAEPGDTVAVMPGTYAEAVVVDKDITLTGDGPREEVVISFSDGETPVVSLIDTTATLSGLTVTGEESQVLVSGGAPRIEDVLFDTVGIPFSGGGDPTFGNSLELSDGTRAEVVGNIFIDGGEVTIDGGSTPTIEANELIDGPHIYLYDVGDGTVIRGNTIRGALYNSIGVSTGGSFLIEGNTLEGAPRGGILGHHTPLDQAPTVRDNTIVGGRSGIRLASRAMSTISGNEISGVEIGINLPRSESVVESNTITDSRVGILAVSGGAPTIRGNDIDVERRGIVAGANTSPIIEGNSVCGGEISILVDDEATPQLGENTIC